MVLPLRKGDFGPTFLDVDLRSLEIKVARSENLPVLPQIVSQVLKLVDDPDASPKQLESIIERDPAITAKILRVANSSYYGLNQVNSIARAISVLGMNQIRSLVISVAYQQVIGGRNQSQLFSKLEFWKHSLATATAARILGKMRNPLKSEELYGAGMMHDVGLLVMDRFCPELLDQAIKYASDTGMKLHEAEQFLFGFDHAQVGGILADKWQLEGMMKAAIVYHHDPDMDDEFQDLTYFIVAANAMAHQCGFKNNAPRSCAEVPPRAIEVLGMPEEQLEVIKSVVANEIQKAQSAFQIS